MSVDYNRLYGGIERCFESVDRASGEGPSMLAVLGFCRMLFSGMDPGRRFLVARRGAPVPDRGSPGRGGVPNARRFAPGRRQSMAWTVASWAASP
jgi:hypothetical protein